ncbi:MAG: glutamine-hydrolyzing GMP synthase [Oscillospiraceae bacterium]|nr:glutamine-hydrolyzing GMP synthase [Oscillospiraceae bacterium]
MSNRQTVLIPDFGAHSLLTARRVRALGVYCEVCPPEAAEERAGEAAGIILGDPSRLPAERFGIPALSFPPEAACAGNAEAVLRGFLRETCGCAGDWRMDEAHIERMTEDIRAQAGGHPVVLGLSGGVDSSVLAALLSRAVGRRLTCIFVDHGLMRLREGDEIEAAFAGRELQFKRVDAAERFLARLAGVTDPERKRKIIGEEFIRVFEEETRKLGFRAMLSQGTIYPDIIESGRDGANMIKSHHNVGGLPEDMDFLGLIEPLRELFKDEVRALGAALALPDRLVRRQPFPGPGLAVRVLGEVTAEKLDILRPADHIFREEIEKAGLDRGLQQFFAVLTGLRTVGVQDGARTYGYTLALRAVHTTDFMTAAFARVPYDVLDTVSRRITDEVPQIGRVVYDVTSKPPGTIEWE